MADKTDGLSPEQIAKANRLRLAKEEGARAMEDSQREAVNVRKNMARLRELRLAKEAEAIRDQPAAAPAPKKVKKAKKRTT
jgi:hypothetical protein